MVAESRAAAFWTRSDLPVEIGGGAVQKDSLSKNQAFDWAFGLEAPELRLYTSGLKRRLEAGSISDLGERVRRFFADQESEVGASRPSPRLLVGALPFDRNSSEFLFLPETVANSPWAFKTSGASPEITEVRAEPTRAAYEEAVTKALHAMAATKDETDAIKKIVLSRSLKVSASRSIDPFDLWSAMSTDPSIVRFLTPIGRNDEGGMRRLVGATPELLISKRGSGILSHPLAGSARRSMDLVQDEAAALSLQSSEKDRREHALVVESILDLLAPYCSQLTAPSQPALVSTRTMWHLGTRIEGRLNNPDEVSSVELAALLHPTPAVCGTPRDKAAILINQLEGYDRGFYAGAVGWTNKFGDGAWYVSLRCAETSGDTARLYAGAGIVEGSDPSAEADETAGKLQTVLQALGVKEVSV